MVVGLVMGVLVMVVVKSYVSMEDVMKGVVKQVNGLWDDNGNCMKQFYDMQDVIKVVSEQLLMENGVIDYVVLVEGGVCMGVINQDDLYEDQKCDLLVFVFMVVKVVMVFELFVDELVEGLGKIVQLYKVLICNIEQLGDVMNYLDDNVMLKGVDIIDVLQCMGGVVDRFDFCKVVVLGFIFLLFGVVLDVVVSVVNVMVCELLIVM